MPITQENVLVINRQNDCTVGVMNFNKLRCFTLELPFLSNEQNVSSIPEGRYRCEKIVSNSLGACIEVKDVIGRTYIRIHKGNYTSQIRGCILVGDSLKDINSDGVIDVTNSTKTLSKFLGLLPNSFDLVIR